MRDKKKFLILSGLTTLIIAGAFAFAGDVFSPQYGGHVLVDQVGANYLPRQNTGSKDQVLLFRQVLSTSNIVTGTATTITASTPGFSSKQIFYNGSGQSMVISVNGQAKLYLSPSTVPQVFDQYISPTAQIHARALSADATSGELQILFEQ